VSWEYDKWSFLQILALVAGVLLEKQVVVVCPNLVSGFVIGNNCQPKIKSLLSLCFVLSCLSGAVSYSG
jgi:hypothetical protein